MEINQGRARELHLLKDLRYDSPIVVGAAALALGFVLGAGRWNWLARGLGRVAESVGTLIVASVAQSVQEQYPQYFKPESRMTH